MPAQRWASTAGLSWKPLSVACMKPSTTVPTPETPPASQVQLIAGFEELERPVPHQDLEHDRQRQDADRKVQQKDVETPQEVDEVHCWPRARYPALRPVISLAGPCRRALPGAVRRAGLVSDLLARIAAPPEHVLLGDDALDHVALDVRQAEVAALVVVGQGLVVDAHQVEHGRVQVVDR